jgi:hypothetical protein
MLALNPQLAAARTPQEKTALERQIAATDAEIDQLVYQLYGLTEAEIKIVERSENIFLQRGQPFLTRRAAASAPPFPGNRRSFSPGQPLSHRRTYPVRIMRLTFDLDCPAAIAATRPLVRERKQRPRSLREKPAILLMENRRRVGGAKLRPAPNKPTSTGVEA